MCLPLPLPLIRQLLSCNLQENTQRHASLLLSEGTLSLWISSAKLQHSQIKHNWRQKCRNFKLCVTNTTYLPHRHIGTQASGSATILHPCCWSSRTHVFCSRTLSKARYLRNLYSHLQVAKVQIFPGWPQGKLIAHVCGNNSIFKLYARVTYVFIMCDLITTSLRNPQKY